MSKIDILAQLAKEHNMPVYSICSYENGTIYQKTINDTHRVNNLYSASKTFTSLAIGMLCDKNLLTMNDNVYDIIGSDIDNCPLVWKQVMLDILLSQRTGLAGMYLDVDSDDISKYRTDDFLELVLTHPMNYTPGEKFGYSDSNFYLASRIVHKVSGKTLQEFLREELFRPMGFQAWSWAVCPQGHAMGGTGLYLNCKDMLRFGIMMMDGTYQGKRYISESWLNNAKQPHSIVNENTYYGWGMWVNENGHRVSFSGAFGQVIHLNHDNNNVYAWQGYDTKGTEGPLYEVL